MPTASEVSEENLELERRGIREEHNRAWTECWGLRRPEKEIEELKRRRR